MKRRCRSLMFTVLALAPVAACQLPTNVALKRAEMLRAEQDACLRHNIPQFDHGSDPRQVGRLAAMSCMAETDKLVQYAIPNASEAEYQAFRNAAAARAGNYVAAMHGAETRSVGN